MSQRQQQEYQTAILVSLIRKTTTLHVQQTVFVHSFAFHSFL